MTVLATIGTWLTGYVGGLVLKLVVDLFNDWLSQRQADTNAKAVGRAETSTTINKEAADAERRANEVAVNRPDVSAVVAGMERGDAF